MKSMRRRPSAYRPEGALKKVSPLGKQTGSVNEVADKPPVSEFESPKLKMAGKLHGNLVL
jgi:hypothetical protein